MSTFVLVLGPMFAGKTTELIRHVRRHKLAQRECVLVTFIDDVRYSSDHIVTHDLVEFRGTKTIRTGDLTSIVNELLYYDTIGIDEAQFFEDAPEAIEQLISAGKHVIASALSGDVFRKPLGCIPRLIPLATKIESISAVCRQCGQDAAYTAVRKLAQFSADKLVNIGGVDKYIAVCSDCYKDYTVAPQPEFVIDGEYSAAPVQSTPDRRDYLENFSSSPPNLRFSFGSPDPEW